MEKTPVDGSERTPIEAPIATEQMARELEAEHCRGKSNLLEDMERYKRLGMLVLKAKVDVIPQSGLTFEEWFKKYVSFSHQWANRCAKLAVDYLLFLDAHNWYCQTGIHDGYKTKRNSGPDYASEVIRLRAKSRREPASETEANDTETKPKKHRPSAKELSDALEQEKAEKLQVAKELARVVSLYQSTDQGEGFESRVLTAVLANAENDGSKVDAVSSGDKAPAAKHRKASAKRAPQDAKAKNPRKRDRVVQPNVAESAQVDSRVAQPETTQDAAQPDTGQ